MNVLITLDGNYIPQGRLMLETLRRHNPGDIHVYVMHTSLTEEYLRELAGSGCRVHPVAMSGVEFQDAPISDRYRLRCIIGCWLRGTCRRTWTGFCIWIRI